MAPRWSALQLLGQMFLFPVFWEITGNMLGSASFSWSSSALAAHRLGLVRLELGLLLLLLLAPTLSRLTRFRRRHPATSITECCSNCWSKLFDPVRFFKHHLPRVWSNSTVVGWVGTTTSPRTMGWLTRLETPNLRSFWHEVKSASNPRLVPGSVGELATVTSTWGTGRGWTGVEDEDCHGKGVEDEDCHGKWWREGDCCQDKVESPGVTKTIKIYWFSISLDA